MNLMTEDPYASVPRQYRISLTVGDHAPGHLRRIARAYLRLWELDKIADTVELALTELTTNVYRHVPDRWCTVTLIHSLSCVRLEVYDRSPVVPVLRPLDPLDAPEEDELTEGGRGLALVDLLTDEWDVHLHRVGKTVWCEIAA